MEKKSAVLTQGMPSLFPITGHRKYSYWGTISSIPQPASPANHQPSRSPIIPSLWVAENQSRASEQPL